MKKSVYLLLACSTLLVGCGEEKFSYNEKYSFSRVEIYQPSGLTVEDLGAYIPAGETFSSVEEFGNYIKENLDTYTVAIGCDRIHFKNDIQSITFFKNQQATWVIGEESATVEWAQVDKIDMYGGEVFAVGNVTKVTFIFENGYVYYTQPIAPEQGFGLKYIFDNE